MSADETLYYVAVVERGAAEGRIVATLEHSELSAA